MIWHISIKLRTSKDSKGFFKSVVVGVFACQLFMWYFLVFSHGVFVSISNGDSSTKTLLLIVCNFRAVLRSCREDIKKEPHCWDSVSFCSESGSFAGVSAFLIWFTVASFVSGSLFCRASRGLSEIDVKYPGLLTPPLEWSWIFGLKEEMTLSNTTIWQRRRTLISSNC